MTEPASFTRHPPTAEIGQRFDALLVDLEGALLDPSLAERSAWTRTVDGFLARVARTGVGHRPYGDEDHDRVLGTPRPDAIRAVLATRNIRLDDGDPSDPPYVATVHGLANQLDAQLRAGLHEHAVAALPHAVALVRRLRARGVPSAAVSASPDALDVLHRAGVAGLFDIVVDATTATRVGLRGIPAPDTLLWAALQLGADPTHTVVLVGTSAGENAAATGGFQATPPG